jgi:hypothetical protein
MLRLRIPSLAFGLVLRRAALAYLAAWVLSPWLAYGLEWRVLALTCMGLWTLLELRAPRSVLLRPNFMILVMWGFVLYTLGVQLIVPDGVDISRHFQMWIMFFFLLAAESARRRDDGELQFMFWTVLLILPTAMIATLSGINNVAGDAARMISRSSDDARMLMDAGIGGYGLVYTVVLVLPFLTQVAWFGRGGAKAMGSSSFVRRTKRLIIIVNWLLCVYLVIRAGYSIALILTVVSTLMVLMVRSRHVVRFGISTALAGTLAFVAVIFAGPLVDNLLDLTTGTEYYSKVLDIRDSFNSNQDVGTVAGRTERYERSAWLIAENPVVGTLRFSEVGKHSAILDNFAQYGLLAGAAFLYLMGLSAWRALRDRRLPMGLALGFFIVSMALPFVNTIFSSWGLILYVFSFGAYAVMGVPLQRMNRGNVRVENTTHPKRYRPKCVESGEAPG